MMFCSEGKAMSLVFHHDDGWPSLARQRAAGVGIGQDCLVSRPIGMSP